MIETLAQLLDRIGVLIVPVRGHDFKLYLEDTTILVSCGLEYRRFPARITLLEMRPALEAYNIGDWANG